MNPTINIKYSTDVEKQEYYLSLLNVISKFGLTTKQLDALTYLCIHAKETRAITDTVKKKCRESLECSASSFSNLLKALNEVEGLINDDILHRYLFVPKDLNTIKLCFLKKEVPLQETKPVNNELPVKDAVSVNNVEFNNDNSDFFEKEEVNVSNNVITEDNNDEVASLSSATVNRLGNEVR